MLTECNVRDCRRLAASVEECHIDSASAGFSKSCRRKRSAKSACEHLFSGSIGGSLRPMMLFVIGNHTTERPVNQEPYVSHYNRSQGAYGLAT